MIYAQCSREEALAAVTQDGMALKHFSHAFRSDKEVVLAAVTQNSDALEFATAELRNDKEVVLKAVARHGLVTSKSYPGPVVHHFCALWFASAALQADELLRALSERKTRAKRLWHLCFVKLRVREIAAWWCKEAAHDEAHFNATGKAQMTGRGAKRSRDEFKAMHKAVRLYGLELLC